MNSFSNLEWLQDPGINPVSILYPFDLISEKAQEVSLRNNSKLAKLYDTQAKERLSEIISICGHAQEQIHLISLQNSYKEYSKNMMTLAKKDRSKNVRIALREWIEKLIEHKYIIAVEFHEAFKNCQKDTLIELVNFIDRAYSEIINHTNISDDHLFFKKDEALWIWEIAIESEFSKEK